MTVVSLVLPEAYKYPIQQVVHIVYIREVLSSVISPDFFLKLNGFSWKELNHFLVLKMKDFGISF